MKNSILYELPQDLKAFSKKAFLKQILPLAVAELVVWLVFGFFGKDVFPPDRFGSGFPLLYRGLGILFPIIILVKPKKLFDRTFFGRVERVDVKTVSAFERKFKPSLEGHYYRNEVTLLIRTDEGRRVRKKVYSERAKIDGNYDFFKEGDRVFHLYGSPVVVRLPQSGSDLQFCPVCGGKNGAFSGGVCSCCGHTLIGGLQEPNSTDS